MNDGHAEAGSGDGYDSAFEDGYAVTVARRDGEWVVAEFDDDFENLDTSIDAVRGLRSEGAAFALLNLSLIHI